MMHKDLYVKFATSIEGGSHTEQEAIKNWQVSLALLAQGLQERIRPSNGGSKQSQHFCRMSVNFSVTCGRQELT